MWEGTRVSQTRAPLPVKSPQGPANSGVRIWSIITCGKGCAFFSLFYEMGAILALLSWDHQDSEDTDDLENADESDTTFSLNWGWVIPNTREGRSVAGNIDQYENLANLETPLEQGPVSMSDTFEIKKGDARHNNGNEVDPNEVFSVSAFAFWHNTGTIDRGYWTTLGAEFNRIRGECINIGLFMTPQIYED